MTKEIKEKSESKPKCFVIMPISDVHGYEAGHFGRVYEHVFKPSIISAGYDPVRADDAVKTDYIVVDIIRQIMEAEIVLCDFSARNPNVMYELGIRHAFDKPVVLTKDRTTDKVFDIQGLRYTEYDQSLRIDSVEKDVVKISAAIKETAKAGKDALNSIVHLAGIRAAQVPAQQTVSPDTQLLLSAIGALERRVSNSEKASRKTSRYFSIDNNMVIFSDGTIARVGDFISSIHSDLNGRLVDVHPGSEEIFIESKTGAIISLSSDSSVSKGLSGEIPF